MERSGDGVCVCGSVGHHFGGGLLSSCCAPVIHALSLYYHSFSLCQIWKGTNKRMLETRYLSRKKDPAEPLFGNSREIRFEQQENIPYIKSKIERFPSLGCESETHSWDVVVVDLSF